MSLAPEQALAVVDVMLDHARIRFAKQGTGKSRRRRDKLQRERLPDLTEALAAYFDGFARRHGIPVEKHRTGKPHKHTPFRLRVNWQAENKRLAKVLEPFHEQFLDAGMGSAADDLGVRLSTGLKLGDYDLSIQRNIATRVRNISDTSRERVRSLIGRGIEQGLSQRDIVRGTDSFPGLKGLVNSWGSPDGRARVIALTETANAYNLGSLNGYRESGVVEEVIIFDGVDCGWTSHGDTDKANGSVRTLDEAEEYPTAHPNCQRSWAPAPVT